LIVGLALGILQIRSIRVANLLPSLVVIVCLLAAAPRLGPLGRLLGL